jgi:hypothetical protein
MRQFTITLIALLLSTFVVLAEAEVLPVRQPSLGGSHSSLVSVFSLGSKSVELAQSPKGPIDAGEPGGASASGGGGAVRAGYLTCHAASGWGFIFGSSRKLQCAYAPQPGYTEYYTGSITKFGADIGYLQSGVILWAVLSPTTNPGQGALAGHYGGATASAAVGVGAGANVLVGGFDSSIALQPVSIEGQNGLNAAAGLVGMTLTYDKNKPAKSSHPNE